MSRTLFTTAMFASLLFTATVVNAQDSTSQNPGRTVKTMIENRQNNMQRLEALKAMTPEERVAFIEQIGVENVRQRLTQHLTRIVEHTTKVIERIAKNDKLTDEEKTTMTTEVQTHQDWAKAQLELLPTADAATLANLITEISEHVAQHQPALRRAVGRHVKARIEGVIAHADNVVIRMNEKIAALKNQGYDTTQLEAAVATFTTQVEAAKAKANEAATAFEAANGEAEAIEAAKALAQEARTLFMDAKKTLHDALKVFRDANAPAATTDTIEAQN